MISKGGYGGGNLKYKSKKVEAKSTDKKTVQLIEDGKQLGELIYKNWFSLKAEVRLSNGDLYEINPVGFFGTSITVTKGTVEIANLKMNWSGHIVFAFKNGEEFVFKAKGNFYGKYIIENKEGEMIIQFNPKFNWSKLDYNYDITYDKRPQDILFVLLGVYASNYFIAAMSGTM
jgi:hypothetical protein